MVIDDEVRALHQLDAHLPCEERMLEVRRIEHPWSQNDHRRFVAGPGRRDTGQRCEQRRAVVVDGPNPVIADCRCWRGSHP